MFLPIMRMNWNLLNAKHRSDYSLKSEIIKKIVAFLIIFFFYRFGVFYMCLGMIMYSLSDWYIITRYTKKVVPLVTMSSQVMVLMPIFMIALTSAAMAYGVQLAVTNVWGQLLFGSFIFGITYLFMSKITNRNEYREIVQLINRK